jgi:hypothetical protein
MTVSSPGTSSKVQCRNGRYYPVITLMQSREAPKKMIPQPCSGTLLLVPFLRRQTLTGIERLFFDPLRSPAFRKSLVYKGHKILQAGIFIRVKV